MALVNETLPRTLGPYLLLARIGRGGMGDVYLARHGMLSGFEKHCVLKMLRDDRVQDAELLARFADEARVVVQLSHRNICPVFDVGRVGDRLYVVLEHIVGRDLRTVALLAPVPTGIALHVIGEVCEALDYAHRFVDRRTGAPLGLVHRDVSPHNVLLGVDGDTKLIDFGIATTRSTTAPSTEVLGKLTYMSPEQARGEVVDHRSDQFSTAVMLTELLLGERFHDGLTTEQVRGLVGEGRYRPARFGSIDEGLRAIIERALAPDREQRFASNGDFADALLAWGLQHGIVATPRDVRRHLLAVGGDLAVEHRTLLQQLDAATAPTTAPDTTDVDAMRPSPAGFDDEGQFESIATTLAAPVHTPAYGSPFGATPSTLIVERDRRVMAPGQPTMRALSTTTEPLQTMAVTEATAPRRATAALVAVAAIAGLGLGVLAMVLRRDDAPAVAVVVETLPDLGTADAGVVVVAVDAGPATAPIVVDAGVTAPPAAPPPPVPPPPAPTPPPPSPPPPSPPPPPPAPPPVARPKGRFDSETRRLLTTLKGCVDKVPCARGVLEWSSGTLSDTDRVQLKDAATDCARRCRFK